MNFPIKKHRNSHNLGHIPVHTRHNHLHHHRRPNELSEAQRNAGWPNAKGKGQKVHLCRPKYKRKKTRQKKDTGGGGKKRRERIKNLQKMAKKGKKMTTALKYAPVTVC